MLQRTVMFGVFFFFSTHAQAYPGPQNVTNTNSPPAPVPNPKLVKLRAKVDRITAAGWLFTSLNGVGNLTVAIGLLATAGRSEHESWATAGLVAGSLGILGVGLPFSAVVAGEGMLPVGDLVPQLVVGLAVSFFGLFVLIYSASWLRKKRAIAPRHRPKRKRTPRYISPSTPLVQMLQVP